MSTPGLKMPSMLTLTDAAAARVHELMNKADEPVVGLRVGVDKRGCSGLMYNVQYATEQKKFEDVVEDKGVRIFIDPSATMFLIGAEMDYKTSMMESGFVFNNPNAIGACGCGESFAVADKSAMDSFKPTK